MSSVTAVVDSVIPSHSLGDTEASVLFFAPKTSFLAGDALFFHFFGNFFTQDAKFKHF